MYSHVILNDNSELVGLSMLSYISSIENILYFPNGIPENISIGWRYINKEWLPPLPPSEEEILRQELKDVEAELRRRYEEEKYNEWLAKA
jgi:hypothetical protein